MLQKGLQCRRSGNDSPQPMRLGMQGPGMPSIAAVALMRAADLDVQAVFWTPESNNSSPHLTARMLRFEVANRGAASSKPFPPGGNAVRSGRNPRGPRAGGSAVKEGRCVTVTVLVM